MAYGFVIDLEKCVGCHGCSVACKEANGTPVGVTRSKVVRGTEGTYPNAKRTITPMLCMMCENPACVEACPTGASVLREDGIVIIDKTVCIGCKTCMQACPYGARYYVESAETGYFGDQLNEYEQVAYTVQITNTVDKCDFCLARNGGTPDPACVKACMTEARWFGDLEEAQAMADARGGSVLNPETGASPRVFYLPRVDV